MDLTKNEQLERKQGGAQRLLAEGDAGQSDTGRQKQAGSEQDAGMQGGRLTQLISTPGQVTDYQRQPGDEPTGETTARLVMSGKQQKNRENDHGVEDQAGSDLENHGPALGRHRGRRRNPIAELGGVLAQQGTSLEATGPHLGVACAPRPQYLTGALAQEDERCDARCGR